MLKRIDELKALLDRKDVLAEAVKENNKAIEIAKKELADLMLSEETTQVVRNGFSYSLQEKVKYSKKAGDDARFLATLREQGLGDLIKETVQAQTLNSAIKNVVEENEGELPEELAGIINVYDYFDIVKRKSSK